MYQAVLDKYAAPPLPEIVSDCSVEAEIEMENPGPCPDQQDQAFDTSMDAWKLFPSVVVLSHFLRESKEYGVRLVLLDGRPTLHFTPGISVSTSPERLDIINQAFDLLLNALPDLEYLVQSGQHIIPHHPGYAPATFTGPSGQRKP